MNIVTTLMNRDGISKEEAVQIVRDLRKFCEECEWDYAKIEDYMLDNLGLEMDYVMEIVF